MINSVWTMSTLEVYTKCTYLVKKVFTHLLLTINVESQEPCLEQIWHQIQAVGLPLRLIIKRKKYKCNSILDIWEAVCEGAQNCEASCWALSCLPRALIVHSSEEMSSCPCCHRADALLTSLGKCQVTRNSMPKME